MKNTQFLCVVEFGALGMEEKKKKEKKIIVMLGYSHAMQERVFEKQSNAHAHLIWWSCE
jgi:hypothetical protein